MLRAIDAWHDSWFSLVRNAGQDGRHVVELAHVPAWSYLAVSRERGESCTSRAPRAIRSDTDMSPASHSPHDNSEWPAPDSASAPELRTLALERAVRWEPVDNVISPLSVPLGTISAVEPLVVHQQALAELEAHAASSRAFAFGVLYGEIYRCPRLHMNYVLVEGVERGRLEDAPPNADLRSTLAALIDRLHASGIRSVGWYRTGASVGLHLSAADAGMHAALFPEQWTVAFVRDALIVHSTAAFFRLVDQRQPYPVPFYEQLPADAYSNGACPRTAIGWSSYHTMTDVSRPETPNAPLPLFDARRVRPTPAPPPAAASRPHTTRARPFEPTIAAPSVPAPSVPAPSVAAPIVAAPIVPALSVPAPTPAPEPAVAKTTAPEPASQSIDRIFDPAPTTSRRHEPAASSRRGLFRTFSSRPRLSTLTLTMTAIAVAIIAAWYLTH